MSRLLVFGALSLICLFGTVTAQTEWQQLTAMKLQNAEPGEGEYLYALLERTAAMLNHDKEQAIEFAELALKEAARQRNASAEAICYLQRSIAVSEMEGLTASEQAYDRAVSLFDPDCSAELRLFYYSHLFYRDRLVKSPAELLEISRLMRVAVEDLDDIQLQLLGELSLFEQEAIASPPTLADTEELRKAARQAKMGFVELALECQAAIRTTGRSPAETIEELTPLADRAKLAAFRPVHVMLLLHLVDAAAKLQDHDAFERYGDDLLTTTEELKRVDWLALALCAKADLALARREPAEALSQIDRATALLPAIDMGNVRKRVQKAAVKTYLGTNQKKRLIEFTNLAFSQDDRIQSRRLQQRLLDFSKQLRQAREDAEEGAARADLLRHEAEQLVVLNETLVDDKTVAESQKTLFQKMTTAGFLLASLLAIAMVISRQRLRRTHAALREEVERNKRNEEVTRSMEMKIAQAERMESLGALAGGIAHDLNNLLVGVLCNAELLEKDRLNETTRKDCTQGIIHSAIAASDLSKKMLAYAGRVPSKKQPCDLNELISNMSPLLRSGLNLKHQLKLDDQTPLVALVDKTQLEQIVMNLATNASNATRELKSPIVTIRTGYESIDEVSMDTSLFGSRAEGGEFVFFEFEDNGPGIGPDEIGRIFEPFFSTREMGQGLGLAVVYGHVTSHRGLLRCVSALGSGTRIRVLLPKSDVSLVAGDLVVTNDTVA